MWGWFILLLLLLSFFKLIFQGLNNIGTTGIQGNWGTWKPDKILLVNINLERKKKQSEHSSYYQRLMKLWAA